MVSSSSSCNKSSCNKSCLPRLDIARLKRETERDRALARKMKAGQGVLVRREVSQQEQDSRTRFKNSGLDQSLPQPGTKGRGHPSVGKWCG